MAGGGGSNKPQQINQNTTTLPTYAKPYYQNLMDRAQAESYRPYTPYGGQRISDFTPDQLATQQKLMGMQTPGQFGQASNAVNQAVTGTQAAANYNPANFNAQAVNNPNLTTFQMQNPELFGDAQAQQYMSPYIQNVLDVQKREALTDAQKGQLTQNLGAARQGTYGGSRQLLTTMERERNLGQQMGDIQARGLQAAYESAQQQFERDRAARMGADQTNLQARLGVQELGSNQYMQAAMQNAQQQLEAQRLAEMSRQFGAQNALQAYNQMGQFGQTLGNLGQMQTQGDLALAGAQAEVGQQQQTQEQKYLDTAYADFLRQRDYPMEQLSYYGALLHGTPIQLNTTQTTYAPPPSMLSQVGGTGLQAASLYNMYNGKG